MNEIAKELAEKLYEHIDSVEFTDPPKLESIIRETLDPLIAEKDAELARLRALCGRANRLTDLERVLTLAALTGQDVSAPTDKDEWAELLAEFEQAAKGGEG